MKFLIIEIDEPVGINSFKINDKVKIECEHTTIHQDYATVRGVVIIPALPIR